MHYFGDSFVTLGQNMDFNEYWCPSSGADNPQISYTLWLTWLELEKTLKLSSRSQSNFRSKVTPK